MKVRFHKVCFGCTGAKRGAEEAPDAILAAYAREHREDNLEQVTLNEPEVIADKFIRVARVGEQLKKNVIQSLENGCFPIIVGGDHSVSLGSISGCASHFQDKRFGIVYVDAHADMNTPSSSPTGNIHGMCLGATLGHGDMALQSVATTKSEARNLLMIGLRSVDEGEKELIGRIKPTVITSDDIAKGDPEEIASRIDAFIKERELEAIHLSVDIDVLDPSVAPATGVPEINGINEEDLYRILDRVLKTGKVKSCDLVEYFPRLDADRKTLKICTEIIRRMAEAARRQ